MFYHHFLLSVCYIRLITDVTICMLRTTLATVKSGFSWAAAVKGSSESANRSVVGAEIDTAISSIVASPHSSIDSSPLQYDASPGIGRTHLGNSTSNPYLPGDHIQLPKPQQSRLSCQIGTMNISSTPQTSIVDSGYVNYRSSQQQQDHHFPPKTLSQTLPAWGNRALNTPSSGTQSTFVFDPQVQYDPDSSISGEVWGNKISHGHIFPPQQQLVHTKPSDYTRDSGTNLHIALPHDDKSGGDIETESDDLFFLQNMQNLRFDLDSPAPEEPGDNPG